ncbi:MAG: HPr(Ser) kinase/phosphatase [Ignavibacteriaceae bacterium]|nr:MAG: HPr kinase/phosphorylase [Chlorobiota bacterium]KXK05866.1 MAG: HPr kinase/phosphorylase [Chlorobi bacterium OLB4]MBV6398306.1 HPr kinase/phosphorylase [Ignavibacteria bacterium]MCC6886103.1 HPr kinase/phosphorylase [Ignavibacteriales bacterium]MCE7952645.1 HPr kinase/phosphorylase [Chlorobi bacterium CHB7]MDL1886757.1 HPr kinase/phosphorylase [Ignavibacteria bacterium CHB1]MEB2329575.1 HPr(Ser) kinase/phosphatase [Ignavibacteriaceae bacterium]OQY77786.1 MAG: HPr kinase/phosphorylase
MKDQLRNIKEIRKEFITVDFFYKECMNRFKIKKISGKDIPSKKVITDQDIHRPGLALSGYFDLFTYKKIQIFGNTEIEYLRKITREDRIKNLNKFFSYDVPCIIITDNNDAPPDLKELADKFNVPLFKTSYPTTKFSYFISDFLDDQFSSQIVLHGSFVDVYGIGLLFSGKSGIGKSEIALDLIERGHRLVADDVVVLSKKAETVLMGSGTSLVEHFMEIRGLGIIDVKSIFGIRSIRYQKRVEVIVELELWDQNRTYERTGLDHKNIKILDVDIEFIKLPIFPGKNITVIVEVIALNYLCKHYGYNAAQVFKKKLSRKIHENKLKEKDPRNIEQINRTIEYFEHDFE